MAIKAKLICNGAEYDVVGWKIPDANDLWFSKTGEIMRGFYHVPCWIVKKVRYKPNDGESYYVINSLCEAVVYGWRGSSDICNSHYEAGNCFKTLEDAQDAAKRIKALLLGDW